MRSKITNFDINYYELLAIPRDATTDEVRAAYQRQCKACHPDVDHSARPEVRREMGERFAELTDAYNVLKDKAKREQYDKILDRIENRDDDDNISEERDAPPPPPPPPPPENRYSSSSPAVGSTVGRHQLSIRQELSGLRLASHLIFVISYGLVCFTLIIIIVMFIVFWEKSGKNTVLAFAIGMLWFITPSLSLILGIYAAECIELQSVAPWRKGGICGDGSVLSHAALLCLGTAFGLSCFCCFPSVFTQNDTFITIAAAVIPAAVYACLGVYLRVHYGR